LLEFIEEGPVVFIERSVGALEDEEAVFPAGGFGAESQRVFGEQLPKSLLAYT